MGARRSGDSYGLPSTSGHAGDALAVVDGVGAWAAPQPVNPHKKVRLTEWDATWQTSSGDWAFGVSGAGAAHSSAASEAGHPGISTLSTGTTAAGRASAFATNTNVILFGDGATYTCEALVRVPILSTALEQFVVRVGFLDAVGADAVDGAYFELDSQADAEWQIKTANNSARTQDTASVVALAGQWYWLKIVVTGGTSVDFYMMRAGVDTEYSYVGTIATNIPTGASRSTAWGLHIVKSVGTTARTLDAEWFHVDAEFSTER